MSGLPATRATEDYFGPELENDLPVADPNKDADAQFWNRIRQELSKCCLVVPIAVVRVANNGTASVAKVLGVQSALVSVTRNSLGNVTVNFDAASGVAIEACTISVAGSSLTCGYSFTPGGNSITILTGNLSSSSVDVGFCLSVY